MGKFTLLAISSVAFLCACQREFVAAPGTLPYPYGDYRYTAYDIYGREVAAGRMTFAPLPAQTPQFVGSWDIQALDGANAGKIGPQLGRGRLSGLHQGSALAVAFNPNASDNSVLLNGSLQGSRFYGEWVYSDLAGILGQGTFEAFREEAPEPQDPRNRAMENFLRIPPPKPD